MNVHLIDQNSEDLLFLFDLLTNGGFNVEASSTAVDGLDRIARVRPGLVLCEFEMQDLNGLEVLERVKRLSPLTEVVLMSDWGGWLQHEEVRRRGGLDLLLKPFGRRDVLRIVERLAADPSRRKPA
jgi:two-component system response regulator HydG